MAQQAKAEEASMGTVRAYFGWWVEVGSYTPEEG